MTVSATTDTPDRSTPVFGQQGDADQAEYCKRLVSRALSGDEKVRTLQQALTKLGIATGGIVQCDHCPDDLAVAGGYVPAERRVVLCQQWVTKQPGEVANTIAHELVTALRSLQPTHEPPRAYPRRIAGRCTRTTTRARI